MKEVITTLGSVCKVTLGGVLVICAGALYIPAVIGAMCSQALMNLSEPLLEDLKTFWKKNDDEDEEETEEE